MKISWRTLYWQLATLLATVVLLAKPLGSALHRFGIENQMEDALPHITAVEAHEIYPMFTCPCCDQPLNKEEPCCGAMIQMLDYIDQKTSTGADKNAIVLATAQEFGLDRLTNETERLALREQLLASAPADAPRLVISETKQDLGVVSQSQGTVSTEFMIKNEGSSDLVVNKLSSSCGCTSGSLIYQNSEGPRFYMAGHGYDEPKSNWQVAIAPGEEAAVKVYYDPSVHPDLVGPVTRTISILSNDPVDFESKLTITLEQTK